MTNDPFFNNPAGRATPTRRQLEESLLDTFPALTRSQANKIARRHTWEAPARREAARKLGLAESDALS